MAYERFGAGALDYFPCRYGKSKLVFRGPEKPLDNSYLAVIGGSETFGKFHEDPFPESLEGLLGRRTINFGAKNASIEAFEKDEEILEICRLAETTVIQITGARNMSNRLYGVHPRRNDRFVRASGWLGRIYGDVDLTDVHFTGHLLRRLHGASEDRFDIVRKELRREWVSRMKAFLEGLGGDVVLLWLSDHSPDDSRQEIIDWHSPQFVDRAMLDELSGLARDLVEVVVSPDEIDAGLERMIFEPYEEPAARRMLGPIAHQEAARGLYEVLK